MNIIVRQDSPYGHWTRSILGKTSSNVPANIFGFNVVIGHIIITSWTEKWFCETCGVCLKRKVSIAYRCTHSTILCRISPNRLLSLTGASAISQISLCTQAFPSKPNVFLSKSSIQEYMSNCWLAKLRPWLFLPYVKDPSSYLKPDEIDENAQKVSKNANLL